jgi:hypothetical protein
MPAKRAKKILQLTITLQEVEPAVWRRVLVPADSTFAQLHHVVQLAMGWMDSHLHCFNIGERSIGMPHIEEEHPGLEDERRVRLESVVREKGAMFAYEYDYGDGWEHALVVEDVIEPDDRFAYPLCIGGARACPPEDCGGPTGYEELLRTLRSARHPEHDHLLTWIGGYFDPKSFDANAVNRAFRFGR